MSGADEVLICKYCSIQLELFSLWRERCRNNDEIFRHNSSDVNVTELLTKYSILDILPSVESSMNESDTTEKSEMITSINELLVNMRTAFDPSNMVESIISSENEFQYPYICNENESDTSSMSQSIKCRVSCWFLENKHRLNIIYQQICDATFKHKKKCSNHFKTQHPMDKQYECNVRKSSFRFYFKISKILLLFQICMMTFKVARIFRHHMVRHESGYVPLVCSICNRKFRSKERYSCHVQKHESDLYIKLPFTNRDRENIVSSWNENNLPKFPLLVAANRK